MIDGVTVNRPMPVFAAALNNLTAVGAVTAAGTVNGYEIAFVGFVHVPPETHELDTDATDDADVAKVCVPVANVVEVTVRFQPAPLPRASVMLNGNV